MFMAERTPVVRFADGDGLVCASWLKVYKLRPLSLQAVIAFCTFLSVLGFNLWFL